MIYNFSFTQANGQNLPLSDFRGKVILIVNTASKCGFTPQYDALEKLYQTYKDQGLIIIGVPCDDFGRQEPGTNEQIQDFCRINFGVSFPIVKKEKITHPFFVYAKTKLGFAAAPRWNFYKYLIDRQGNLVDFFVSTTSPEAGRVKSAIEHCLNQNR